MDAVDTLFANTRNNPIEDMESHLPLRVERYELREDVVAPGEWRGGIGSVREFTYLGDGGFSIEGDGHKFRPWGFGGGTDGQPQVPVILIVALPDVEMLNRLAPTARNVRTGLPCTVLFNGSNWYELDDHKVA
jgi:N-methylhydantoinase B